MFDSAPDPTRPAGPPHPDPAHPTWPQAQPHPDATNPTWPQAQPHPDATNPAWQPVPPGCPAPAGYPVPAPQPGPRRRHGWARVGGVLLAVAVGIGVVVVKTTVRDAIDGGGTSAGGPTLTLTAPDTIGTLVKSADQSRAAGLRAELRSSGVTTPFAAAYADQANPGRTMLIWGGTGATVGRDAGKEIDAFFTSAAKALKGGSLGHRANAGTGTVGGSMQCATVDGLGVAMAACAWAGPGAMLGAMVTAVDQAKGTAQIQAALPSIVIKS